MALSQNTPHAADPSGPPALHPHHAFADAPALADRSAVLRALERRHAAKVFDEAREIADAEFALVLEAARRTPTSFGLEPFEIVVIQGPEQRARLRDVAWGAHGTGPGAYRQLDTASHFGVLTAYGRERLRYDSPYLRDFLREVKGFDEAGAARYAGVLETFQRDEFHLTDERTFRDWAARQAYLALANMMTCAADLGIDSCPIEGFDPEAVRRILAEELGVDMSYQYPAVMFAFGYAGEAPRRPRTRRPMARVVRWV